MFDLSPIQLVLVLVIALLAIGPKRLPEVGRTIGRTMREVRGVISLDDAGEDGADRRDRTPTRTDVVTGEVDSGSARAVAVGGEDLDELTAPPTTDDVVDRDGETDDGQPPQEQGPAVEDMVVRGRRGRP